MAQYISVITPENVTIEYELAGLGSRGWAVFLDLLIQGIILLCMGALYFWFLLKDYVPGSGWLSAISLILMFMFVYGYFLYFETVWQGQTPGKRAAGIRVINRAGSSIGLIESAIRNLIRLIDFLPVAYVIGVITIFAGSSQQRLGDLAAGTLVVKLRSKPTTSPIENSQAKPIKTDVAYDVSRLSKEEISMIKTFAERLPEMDEERAEELAKRFADIILPKLNIIPSPSLSASSILMDIYRCLE